MDRYTAREIVLKSDLSRGAKMLYMALDNHQRETPYSWPSQKTLCETLNCSPRMLRYYLVELREADYCRWRKTRLAGPNEYHLFYRTDGLFHSSACGNSPNVAMDCRTIRQSVAAQCGNGLPDIKQTGHLNPDNEPNVPSTGFEVVENPPESKPLPLKAENQPQPQRQKLPCHACKGSGSILIPTGYAKCGQCNGTGNSSYRSAAAIERREKYLQTARGGFERARQLAAEGFPPLGRSPALQRALEPEFGASREHVAEFLRSYPRAGALRGVPDADIVSRTMSAAGNWEALKSAVRAMNESRATPTQSWGWFPAVVGRYCRRKAA